MDSTKLLRLILHCMICCALAGCSLDADLIHARAQEIDKEVIVEVAIDSVDARFIKRREIYAYIVVKECDGGGVRFPIEPWISRQRISEFVFPVEPGIVSLSGAIPVAVFNAYKHPCATLEGGSYGLGKVASKAVPIEIQR